MVISTLTYLGAEDLPHSPGCFFSVKNFGWSPVAGDSDDQALGLLLADTHYQFRYPVLQGE